MLPDWKITLFDEAKKRVLKGEPLPEDSRCTDWQYYLPLHQIETSLVLGAGKGTLPMALAETLQKVYVVDSDQEALHFLETRSKQQGKTNIHLVHLKDEQDFPFSANQFDLVVCQKTDSPFSKALEKIHPLLKKGGYLFVPFKNSLGFDQLFDGRNSSQKMDHGNPFRLKKLLKKLGFEIAEWFVPLPQASGIPLFTVPFSSTEAWNFFLKSLFPLFAAVSPEVKQMYGKKYLFAQKMAWLVSKTGLINLAKFFAPGFTLLAKKTV